MARGSLLIAAGMLVILVGTVRQDWAGMPKVLTEAGRVVRQRERDAAIQMNAQAGQIHALRDQEYAVGKVLWNRKTQNVWTMPNIHAVGEDGNVADGCRALEAIRLLWEIDNIFGNLRGARTMVQRGVLASDLVEQEQKQGLAQYRTSAVGHVENMTVYNPVDVAERRYLREHGVSGMSRAVEGLLNDLFSAKSQG